MIRSSVALPESTLGLVVEGVTVEEASEAELSAEVEEDAEGTTAVSDEAGVAVAFEVEMSAPLVLAASAGGAEADSGVDGVGCSSTAGRFSSFTGRVGRAASRFLAQARRAGVCI